MGMIACYAARTREYKGSVGQIRAGFVKRGRMATPASQRPPADSGSGALRLVTLVFYLVSMASLLFFAWSALSSSLRYDRYGSYSDDQIYYTEYPSPTPTPLPVTARIGETITLGAMAATLVSVKIIAGDQTYQPKQGDTFILAHVTLANLSTAPQDYSSWSFMVTTSSGHPWDYHAPVYDAPASYTADNLLSFGRLGAKESVAGDLVVEAPLGDHQAKLVWDPNSTKVGESGWILGL